MAVPESHPVWLRILPASVRARIENRPNLLRILSNMGWLFADRVLRMGVGLIVGVWIARYLGPQQFGLWSYVIAFTSLFGAFANLGLDSIVVRELVKHPDRQRQLLGSALILKLAGGVFALVVSVATMAILRTGEVSTLVLVAISSAGYVFQSCNVADFYFQSKTQSRYAVYATNSAFAVITLAKIILLLHGGTLLAFALAGLVEVVLSSIFLTLAMRMNGQKVSQWQFDASTARELLRSSWPLMISGIAVMVYMRIDQIMIGELLGDLEVGLFSAAVKLSELWYFVPLAIVSSVYPALIAAKEQGEEIYYQRLHQLFKLMARIGLAMALVMTLLGGYVMQFLFGAAYVAATGVLVIHTWAGIFVSIGLASGTWLTTEDLQKYSFYRTVYGGFANVLLNLWLIPLMGIEGAAIATVASYGVSVYSIGIYAKCRRVFGMMCRSLYPF